jgi:cbb3-type cytochrome oxidase maturation protein
MPSYSDTAPFSHLETTELMSVIFLLIAASTLVAAVFLAAFIRAVRSGQYDDDRSPAVRMLHDPTPPNHKIS